MPDVDDALVEKTRREDEARTMEYISTRGIRAIFRPLPFSLKARIETDYERDHPRPAVPTYTVETIGGDTETHEHDKTTVVGDPDAEAAWAAYLRETELWEEQINRRFFRAILASCVTFPDVDFEEWAERMEYLGVTVPENRYERLYVFVDTEFVGSRDDMTAFYRIPMQLTLEKSAALEAVERMFQRAVEGWYAAERAKDDGEQVADAGRAGSDDVEPATDTARLGDETE